MGPWLVPEMLAYTVEVHGTFASVVVEQVFVHHGDRPIDAVYVVPLAADAWVGELSLDLDGRPVAGGFPAPSRPEVLARVVPAVGPGDRVHARTHVETRARITGEVVEVVVPLAAAPRIVTGAAWAAPGFEAATPAAGPDAAVLATWLGEGTVLSVASPSHDLVVTRVDGEPRRLQGRASADRDLVLRWTVAPDEPEPWVRVEPGRPFLSSAPVQRSWGVCHGGWASEERDLVLWGENVDDPVTGSFTLNYPDTGW